MTDRSLFLIPSNLGFLDVIRYLLFGMDGLDTSQKGEGLPNETKGIDIWMVLGLIPSLAIIFGGMKPFTKIPIMIMHL